MCDVTHSYLWHDPCICAAWRICMCHVTFSHVWHDEFRWVARRIYMRVIMYLHVWHDACVCVVWRIHMCCAIRDVLGSCRGVPCRLHVYSMTHPNVCHDSFKSGTWLIQNLGHDSFKCCIWLSEIWDITRTNVGQESFKICDTNNFNCEIRLIQIKDMMHSICIVCTYTCMRTYIHATHRFVGIFGIVACATVTRREHYMMYCGVCDCDTQGAL